MVERETLVDAIADLLAATEPYVEEAAPGETLSGAWEHRFQHLTRARANAVKAASAPGPGTRLYQLTDEQAKALLAITYFTGPNKPYDAVDQARVVLSVGLDDSEKEGVG